MPGQIGFITEQIIGVVITIVLGLAAFAFFRLSCEKKYYDDNGEGDEK